jgi:8-oxo-dGTP diphosphatase
MKVIDVAAGLVFRDRKLLITQRHQAAHLGGLWEFPGGKREPDESFEQCLRRELLEELGIEVEVGSLVESLTHAYPEKTVHLKFYLCRCLAGDPQPIDCAALEWIDSHQLASYAFPPADARLLARLRETKEWWS